MRLRKKKVLLTWWKRPFDLLIALPALVILAPVIAVLALLVRVKLGAPVLFRQQRPGLHGSPFRMVKFRTMTDARDASGALLPDAERLTSFGRFLHSSLDELPELWHMLVLRGMSQIVGTSPALGKRLWQPTQRVPSAGDVLAKNLVCTCAARYLSRLLLSCAILDWRNPDTV